MFPTKIINDPIYGFIKINNPFILKLIDHPFVQRLKRIKQLGLAEFVYPGAHHTRFHHASYETSSLLYGDDGRPSFHMCQTFT